MKQLFFTCYAFITMVWQVSAQSWIPDTENDPPKLFIPEIQGTINVEFHNLNKELNISIRETNSISSDDYGFIWVSSKMGIIRYVEGDVRVYQLPYDNANILTVRLVFKNGQLYAYSDSGQIFKYNTLLDRFELVLSARKELNNYNLMVNKILLDDSERMWISTTFGLYCFHPEEGIHQINEEKVFYITWFDKYRYFYANADKIKLFDIRDQSSVDYYTFSEGTNYNFSKLYFDAVSNTLWIGTISNGLLCIRREKGQHKLSVVSSIPNQPILAIESVSDQTILIGIDGQGVWEITKDDGSVLNIFKENPDNINSLKGNGVYDIYCDNNNRVWISTYSGGVSYFRKDNSYFTQIKHIPGNSNSLINNDVNSILEDRNRNLWFATNNGISFYNTKLNFWKSFYNNDETSVFLAMCEDRKGRIWAGTYSSGLYVLDGKTGKELFHYSSESTDGKFNSNFILDIYEDTDGDIWIGSARDNLICYNIDQNTFSTHIIKSISVFKEYGKNKILIGRSGSLLLLDKKSKEIEELITGCLIQDILLKDDEVWICTNGEGVLRFNMNTHEKLYYTVENGLPSNFVNSIEFSNGYFWIGTEQGMCRLSDDGKKVSISILTKALNEISFNRHARFKLNNGTLIWGTNDGGIVFDPRKLRIDYSRGKIFFQNLWISGQSIRESPKLKQVSTLDSLEELSLKYYDNNLILELLALEVSSPNIKFTWRLEGLDDTWSKLSKNRIISYSNIPNGKYTLSIRLIDTSTSQLITERSIALDIVPPFWKKWWFLLLEFVFGAGLIIFVILYYINNLRKKHSEEKIRFFSNTAHEIRTSLTLINGPIEELNKETDLSKNGEHFLHLATEQSLHLAKVVTQLMDFQKVDTGKEKMSFSNTDIVELTKKRIMLYETNANIKGVHINFSSNIECYETSIDRLMIEKVIDNLISNALKYSYHNSRIKVELNCNSKSWNLEVQDWGIGIAKEEQKYLFREFFRGKNAVNNNIIGSGIGLLLVRNYIRMHGGRINWSSQKNQGTTFEVVVPYRKHVHLEKEDQNVVMKPDFFSIPRMSTPDHNKQDFTNIPKMKILIVEDHDYLREFLTSALNKQFDVLAAKNGEKAWETISKMNPDLVVSDIMMPKMNGFELCKKMKSTWETSHIPIILLTALSGKAQQLHGLGLGADDYLVKPFDTSILQQRIKAIIRNRQTILNRMLKLIKIDKEEDTLINNEYNDKFLKKMVEVAKQNISNSEFNKNNFASEMNVSPSLLYQKVKTLTDQSPSDFIRTVRLEHSLELLQLRKYSITEVSEICGFKNVGYFSTVFKKHYGKSPTQIV